MAHLRDSDINGDTDTDSGALLLSLRDRADRLLANLRAYQTCLKIYKKQQEVELRTFKRGVESEVKSQHTVSGSTKLETSTSDLSEFDIEELRSKRLHALRSSNLPFYEAVWAVASQCTGIVALGKRVYCDAKSIPQKSRPKVDINGNLVRDSRLDKKNAVVDIIAQDGLEWIKVSTITEKRLLFEMAKEGWEAYHGDSDSEDYRSEGEDSSKDRQSEKSQLELVKLAYILQAASQNTRVQYKHPRVRFVLPKIEEGLFHDVDAVIADIRSLGIQVTCKDNSDSIAESNMHHSLQNLDLNHTAYSPDLTRLLPSISAFRLSPTPVLNIDCTILLALISDISHIKPADLPDHPTTGIGGGGGGSGSFHKAIINQINVETESPLLLSELYPLVANRKLVCTSHAAQRMREIVQTMGTPTERHRADILLGENNYAGSDTTTVRSALATESCHSVPDDLGLPIEVVEFDAATAYVNANLNDRGPGPQTPPSSLSSASAADERIRRKVHERMRLSAINESVFLYGWCERIVTVTSNRVIAVGLVKCINEILDEEEREKKEMAGVKGGGSGDGVLSSSEEKVDDNEAEFEGPKMYVCETARSLIGKEKQGRQR